MRSMFQLTMDRLKSVQRALLLLVALSVTSFLLVPSDIPLEVHSKLVTQVPRCQRVRVYPNPLPSVY
jgi:hypothetical protein